MLLRTNSYLQKRWWWWGSGRVSGVKSSGRSPLQRPFTLLLCPTLELASERRFIISTINRLRAFKVFWVRSLADPPPPLPLCPGLVEENGEHGRPARHPHALLHHRTGLLRRLQARHAAGQPPPGETTVGGDIWPNGGRGRGGMGKEGGWIKTVHVRLVAQAVSAPSLKRFMWLFLGAEGLLRSPHVRAAVQSRTFYPHQLDGPRRQRLLLVLQRLRPHPPSLLRSHT